MMRIALALVMIGCNPAPPEDTDAADTNAGLGGPGPDHDTLEQDDAGCFLLQGPRSADLALVASACYRLTGVFDVSGATLSAAPGTRIYASPAGGLLVAPDAVLSLEGSADAPIRFEPAPPPPEDPDDTDADPTDSPMEDARVSWRGIYLRSENPSRLEHVILDGAAGALGQGAAAAISVSGAAALRSIELDNSQGHGLRLEPTARLTDLSMVHFGQTGLAAISLNAGQLRDLGSGLSFAANDAIIEVSDANITGGTHVWRPQPAPIHMTGTIDVRSASVTLEPGLTLLFRPGTALHFDLDTQLRSLGQPDAPVVLRGTDGAASWRGLFVRSRSAESVLQHTHILDGGSARYLNVEADNANLVISDEARLILAACRFEGSGGYGISVTNSGRPDFQGPSTFAANAWGSLRLSPRHLADLNDALILPEDAPVAVRAGIIDNQPGTWPRMDAPVEIEGLVTLRRAAIVVAAGGSYLFHDGAGILVETTASLTAVGSVDDPIVLAGSEPGPGTWRGLAFASNSTQNQIQEAIITGAGARAFDGAEPAAVALLPGARLRLLDSHIAESGGWGVWRSASTTLDPAPPTGMSYADNLSGNLN